MIRSALYTGCNSVQSGGAATPGELAGRAWGRAARSPGLRLRARVPAPAVKWIIIYITNAFNNILTLLAPHPSRLAWPRRELSSLIVCYLLTGLMLLAPAQFTACSSQPLAPARRSRRPRDTSSCRIERPSALPARTVQNGCSWSTGCERRVLVQHAMQH